MHYHDAISRIESSHKITIVSHITPDADALGTSLALYLALKQIGKNVKVFNATKVLATRYDFLPSYDKITSTFPKNCDLVISCDCGSFDRLGIKRDDFFLINIDHHKSNQSYGDINIIDPSLASTSLVLLALLSKWEPIMIDKNIATCIYTALAEDTNFFTTQNVNASVFNSAKELVALGANPSHVASNLQQRDSLAKLRLTALFIDTLELLHEGDIALGFVDENMFKISGALRYDTTEFVDILLHLATVKVAIFVLELPSGDYKLSLRSREKDLSAIATKLGGGGHHHAAGLSVTKAQKETILQQIIDEVSR